jgi:glutamine synthetase adenylyltransferase
MLMKMPQPISRYPALLTAQHERGIEMTAYLIDVTRDGKLPMGRAKPLARALLAFKQMYEQHAVHEDTYVYLAWQNALSPAGRNEMQAAFAEIEQRMLGQNAYEEALNRLVAIENNLGIADLGQYTMPDIRTY